MTKLVIIQKQISKTYFKLMNKAAIKIIWKINSKMYLAVKTIKTHKKILI